MENRVAVIMLNYNMPEVIEQNIAYIKRAVKWPVDIFLVEQSDNDELLEKYDFRIDVTACAELSQNLHATQGFNLCCRLADAYGEYKLDGLEYFAYWVITTTGLLDPDGDREDDCLSPCVEALIQDDEIAIVQPAYRQDSIGFWEHLKDRGTGQLRRVHMIEHSAALFEGDWFREIGFMEPKIHIHGTDLWYSYLARMEGRKLCVHEGTWIKRFNNNMHDQGRSFEGSPAARTVLARQSLEKFGEAMLGPSWEQRMFSEYATPDMM